jgi:hypothetical protein
MPMRTLTVLLCLTAICLAAACGRKSDPLTPYESQLEQQRQAEKEGGTAPEPVKPEEDKPFILDRLIQ